MSLALSQYLKAIKDSPDKRVKCLSIDNCSMKDAQFAQILEGIAAQGQHIQTIVYSSGEMSHLSTGVLPRLYGNLKELHFNNTTRGYGKLMFNEILEEIMQRGWQLEKLKISNINLNDAEIVQKLCNLIEMRTSLAHLDLSWTRLSPK